MAKARLCTSIPMAKIAMGVFLISACSQNQPQVSRVKFQDRVHLNTQRHDNELNLNTRLLDGARSLMGGKTLNDFERAGLFIYKVDLKRGTISQPQSSPGIDKNDIAAGRAALRAVDVESGAYMALVCPSIDRCRPPGIETLKRYRQAVNNDRCGRGGVDARCKEFLFGDGLFLGIAYPINVATDRNGPYFDHGDYDLDVLDSGFGLTYSSELTTKSIVVQAAAPVETRDVVAERKRQALLNLDSDIKARLRSDQEDVRSRSLARQDVRREAAAQQSARQAAERERTRAQREHEAELAREASQASIARQQRLLDDVARSVDLSRQAALNNRALSDSVQLRSPFMGFGDCFAGDSMIELGSMSGGGNLSAKEIFDSVKGGETIYLRSGMSALNSALEENLRIIDVRHQEQAAPLVRISLGDGQTVSVTKNHPFFVLPAEVIYADSIADEDVRAIRKQAQHLGEGDLVLGLDEDGRLDFLPFDYQAERAGTVQKTYNFVVQRDSDFKIENEGSDIDREVAERFKADQHYLDHFLIADGIVNGDLWNQIAVNALLKGGEETSTSEP